ncbi:MAG: glycogen debranching protein [Desulfococcus sp.]|nr:MAG: glycogen debranching protein [Desulfococcus sp.]
MPAGTAPSGGISPDRLKELAGGLKQTPEPGRRLLRFRGDLVTFELCLPEPVAGSARLRTNLGRAAAARREIIREVLLDEPPLGTDWRDIPMEPVNDRLFRLTLPLTQVGHFEAKALFFADGVSQPVWPGGANTVINTAPADNCADLTLYNAFVRQFGENKHRRRIPSPEQAAAISGLDRAEYTVIPKSGTFRDMIKELDFIIYELGCRYIQLLPIHPTPTTYARMGRFGSPYASLGFTAVDPGLAEFDPAVTPLEQFTELLDAVHARDARLLLDIAINHTGWAARIHETHPEWLARTEDGRIEMPGAWGVTWADLTRLDYAHRELWDYMARVFLLWCRRGVDGFRCDAGYMIPKAAWRFLIARVRTEYPDTVFFLEGLGGRISVTRDLLNTGGMDWAYSELFQNYTRHDIESYLPGALEIAETDGLLIHYCETHDNNRLAAVSPRWARMRTALCALYAPNGGFAFANGVEWLATEKIDVHEAMSLNWGSEKNQVAEIRILIRLLKRHPAFHDRARLQLIQAGEGNGTVLLRRHEPSGKWLVIPVNLSHEEDMILSWKADIAPPGAYTDLLTGRTCVIGMEGGYCRCPLGPGEVLCLSPDPADTDLCPDAGEGCGRSFPDPVRHRRLRALVLDVHTAHHGVGHLDFDPDGEIPLLTADPLEWCRRMHPAGSWPAVIEWRWPADARREVMIPPGHFLLISCPHKFRAHIAREKTCRRQEESLARDDGTHFVLFTPLEVPAVHQSLQLRLSVFPPPAENGETCLHEAAPLLLLADPETIRIDTAYSHRDVLHRPLLYLATNGRGGMLRAHAAWGALQSRYDALLAANLHPDVPDDRWMLLARVRGWIVFQGFSTEISQECQEAFSVTPGGAALWSFRIPTGQGESIRLRIRAEMETDQNRIHLLFGRSSPDNGGGLDDADAVTLILRPDIEDRSFHETTKAYAGPEERWPGAVRPLADGFIFQSVRGRKLLVRLDQGTFHPEPEWWYMLHRPVEEQRGLDPLSDLFSPGWFGIRLAAGEERLFIAECPEIIPSAGSFSAPGTPSGETHGPDEETGDAALSALPELPVRSFTLDHVLSRALDQFVVRRDRYKTVIAGYPWFLDWGRDTLIVVRGLIADGRLEESADILKQFALYEDRGTIPNMIRGTDAGNRDTSDAPLWFFVACAELIKASGTLSFLEETVGDRSLAAVLSHMADALISGTPNGIHADLESGLLYSPSHFTWMDTNYPAGTPRQGYPVEIQGMWRFALDFLASVDNDNANRWRALADQVRESIERLFWLPEAGYFSDCLHAVPHTPAERCPPDDHLRPNQLFAITLGAVTDMEKIRRALASCEELLVPGAIRTLADRRVETPLPVWRDGRLLNDPHYPYQGHYGGDEDTARKPAYHNGTAWPWVFPSYCEALAMAYGTEGARAGRALLGSCSRLLSEDCVGQLPEILDGNAPHDQRGCDAQAWSVSEALRVWRLLGGLS